MSKTLGFASITLGAMFTGGLYFLYKRSREADYESRELDRIASEALSAELRAQEMGRLARARIIDIANQSGG